MQGYVVQGKTNKMQIHWLQGQAAFKAVMKSLLKLLRNFQLFMLSGWMFHRVLSLTEDAAAPRQRDKGKIKFAMEDKVLWTLQFSPNKSKQRHVTEAMISNL